MSETNVKKATGVAPAMVKPETIDQLLSGINPADLASPEVFRQLKKAIIERALGAELSVHWDTQKATRGRSGKPTSVTGRAPSASSQMRA